MKATEYKTSHRTRRETFADGSQLVRRAGGSYEIIEARPKYEVVTTTPRKDGRKNTPSFPSP